MIMRAEEECLSFAQMHRALTELMHYCDNIDCMGITEVLSHSVAGFGGHEVRHDHVWVKQGKAGKRSSSQLLDKPANNVQSLFPERNRFE
jgi:hypothetical protein